MPSHRLLSVLLSANILLLCAAVASAEAPITNWSEDPAPPTLPTKVDPVLQATDAPEPSMPAQTELLQVKSKFMALMQAATKTKAAAGSIMETYCVEVNNPDWNTEDALAAWKPDVPGSCWTPLSNLATTICSDTCTNSSVLATLFGGTSSARRLMGGAMDNVHTSLCEDDCFNPFVRDLLALAKQFTKAECASAFEDDKTSRRRRKKTELIESHAQNTMQESDEQWVEAKNQPSSRQLMGGGMGGALSEETVTKLEITFGLLCSKNPEDGEYCLTKFHTLTQQDWTNVPISDRRRRRRRRKAELTQVDEQCAHWDVTTEGTEQAGVQGYAACNGETGTKDCWHDWCNANCETAAGVHPACAVDDASTIGVHTRCACGVEEDGIWIWGKTPDDSHTHTESNANTTNLQCPINDAQKSQLSSIGCCWGDVTLWSAQGDDLPELHTVHHLAEDCGIELSKTPCASDLKSSSVEITVTLTNTSADFNTADIQAAFRAAVASTASGIFSTEVSITDFDDSERTIDLTAALVEGVTGSIEVNAQVTLVGDQAQNQASVKTQVEVASSLQTSLDSTATGSNLAGAQVTGVVATAGYSQTAGSSGAAQLQASWLFLCALVLCTATHIQQWL